MLATRIPDHVAQALDRLLQQYKGKPRIAGLLTAFVNGIQDLEDTTYSLDAGRQLWDGTTTPAVGAQLDGIGDLVGVKRNGLDDMEYTLVIFGKIAENFSNGTIFDIGSVLQYVFQAQEILIEEIFPAALYINVLAPAIPKTFFALAKNLLMNTIGGGINVITTSVDTTAAFRFAGPGVTGANNGFGNGVLVGLI